jgi:hypothetical protein
MLIFITFLNVLFIGYANGENSNIINYITLDGVLHNGFYEESNFLLNPDLTAWAKYENNINKTGFVFNHFKIDL